MGNSERDFAWAFELFGLFGFLSDDVTNLARKNQRLSVRFPRKWFEFPAIPSHILSFLARPIRI